MKEIVTPFDDRANLVAEIERLRAEGSERGWFCETCRYWHAPYRPEDSDGKVIPYKKCPQCKDGSVMFAVTKDWVLKRDAEAEVDRLTRMLSALGFCVTDGESLPCMTCGAGL
jgi:hypothetical protein